MSKFEIPKHIKAACLISSAAFSMLASDFGLCAVFGESLGLLANMPEKPCDFWEIYTFTINRALNKTAQYYEGTKKQKIVKELYNDVLIPYNLEDLIKKTDTYKSQYYTKNDAKEIIGVFDMYFTEEICNTPVVAYYTIMSQNTISFDKLKEISNIIYDNSQKTDEVLEITKENLTHTKQLKNYLENILTGFFECLTYSLVSMACFLILLIPFNITIFNGNKLVVYVFIGYVVSEIITAIIKTRYPKITNHNFSSKAQFFIFSGLVSILPPIAIFALFITAVYDGVFANIGYLYIFSGSVPGFIIKYLNNNLLFKNKPN